MFGYVKPDLPYLYLKDDKLYKALYCGVCKNISSFAGQRARLGLTYDIAFLSALVHNLKGKDVEIKGERCVVHPMLKRPMASRDEITEACAATNVILAYYKCVDDLTDSGKGGFKKGLFAKGHKISAKKYKNIDEIVSKRYEELLQTEIRKENRIDVVSEPFSMMMKQIGGELLGVDGTQATGDMFYFLGKWIYLIDAIDDYDKDLKKKNYNPFYYFSGKASDFKTLMKEKGEEISFVFADIFARINESADECKWKFNHDLIDNILKRGLPSMTLSVIKKATERAEKKKERKK